MNSIEHIRESLRTHGIITSLLSVLPDLFVAARTVFPVYPVNEWCWKMHHSEDALTIVSKIGLRASWEEHMSQDMVSHSHTYDFADRVPKDSVILLSGGLDSFVAWRLLGQPKAVYFALGHRYQTRELERLSQIKLDFNANLVIDDRLQLGDLEKANGYIPYRNLLLLTLAAEHSDNIIWPQICEWAPDKNSHFNHAMQSLLREAGSGKFQNISRRTTIWTPFIDFTKTQMVKEYVKHWLASDLSRYTTSCYHERLDHCGECSGCRTRYVAMVNNGLSEDYFITPRLDTNASVSDFRLRMLGMYVRRWLELRSAKRKLTHHVW